MASHRKPRRRVSLIGVGRGAGPGRGCSSRRGRAVTRQLRAEGRDARQRVGHVRHGEQLRPRRPGRGRPERSRLRLPVVGEAHRSIDARSRLPGQLGAGCTGSRSPARCHRPARCPSRHRHQPARRRACGRAAGPAQPRRRRRVPRLHRRARCPSPSASSPSTSPTPTPTPTTSSPAPTGKNCTTNQNGGANNNVTQLDGDTYHLQANEYNSGAAFKICTDGNPDFTISTSGVNVSHDGAPGAYPSIYKGCHWGYCTANSGMPVAVSTMAGTPDKVTTSYSTSTVDSGAWDDSYDIWYNPAQSTNNNSSGLEMMIWLNHFGGVQPAEVRDPR